MIWSVDGLCPGRSGSWLLLQGTQHQCKSLGYSTTHTSKAVHHLGVFQAEGKQVGLCMCFLSPGRESNNISPKWAMLFCRLKPRSAWFCLIYAFLFPSLLTWVHMPGSTEGHNWRCEKLLGSQDVPLQWSPLLFPICHHLMWQSFYRALRQRRLKVNTAIRKQLGGKCSTFHTKLNSSST